MLYGFTLFELFKLGGIFMWPLLLFSVIGVAFIIERSYIFLKSDLKPNNTIPKMFDNLKTKDVKKAKESLENSKKNHISDVLKTGLDMIEQDIGRMEKSMEAATTIKVKKLEKGLNVFVVLSNIAPLTGFLGTVSGMINAFKSIATAEEVSTQLVAIGIYEALITTVAGLIIAIVVVSAYNIFIHKIDNFISDTERFSNEMIETLIEQKIK
ncbi:MAG: MotA/TolQ/ExbB proton channel family protein [Candidatus Firestonebacteria bacterium]